MGDGGACCQNDLGNDFPCGAGSTWGGNGCAAPGSKCCELATTGYKYPVTKDTACSKELSIVCHNRNDGEFLCGADSSCCGDVCSEPGGTCCKNTMGNNFVCAPGNFCCGNACASKDSKCCKDPNTGYEFPLLKSTPCPASLLQTSSNDWSKMKLSSLQPKLLTSGADGIETARYTDVLQQPEQCVLVRGARRMLREWMHVWALLQELRRLSFRLRKRQ